MLSCQLRWTDQRPRHLRARIRPQRCPTLRLGAERAFTQDLQEVASPGQSFKLDLHVHAACKRKPRPSSSELSQHRCQSRRTTLNQLYVSGKPCLPSVFGKDSPFRHRHLVDRLSWRLGAVCRKRFHAMQHACCHMSCALGSLVWVAELLQLLKQCLPVHSQGD